MMIHRCIFRRLYGEGACCNKLTNNTDPYCNRHKNKQNYIFEIMAASLKNNKIQSDSDLYEILKYIYTNDTYKDSVIENNPNYKKELFLTIVCYLLSKHNLMLVLYRLIFLNGQTTKYKKRNTLTTIHDIFFNTFQFSKDDSKLNHLIRIQRFSRRHLYRKIIRYNNCPSENTEDPFTFDGIHEIPINQKFSYKDENNHIYIFDAIEFEYFVRENGTWNPYTKSSIPEYIINQLYLLIQYNGLSLKNKHECKWTTPLHAYTEVSQLMEKQGFYNNVEWFTKFTYNTCKKIINVYRDISANVVNSHQYFPINFEMNKNNYVFDFCKEIINLFKNADDHYLLCCNFMKALAINSDEFYNNTPIWLMNIDSQSELMNISSSPLLYVYVQNLMEDNESHDVLFQLDNISNEVARTMFNIFMSDRVSE